MQRARSTYYFELSKADQVAVRNHCLADEIKDIFSRHKGRYTQCFIRARHSSASVPLYAGGRRVCAAQNNFGFRRFLTRGKGNIRMKLFFLALAFDLKKLWMKREHNRLKTRVSLKIVS